MPEKREPRKADPKKWQPSKDEILLAVQKAYNEWHDWTDEESLKPLSREAAESREFHDSLKEHIVIVLDEMLDQAEDGEFVSEALHQINWSIEALSAVRDRLLGMAGYTGDGD